MVYFEVGSVTLGIRALQTFMTATTIVEQHAWTLETAATLASAALDTLVMGKHA
eukprot:COSAG06_NODE_37164_length_438_cov_1.070796_1_plen_53_part_10